MTAGASGHSWKIIPRVELANGTMLERDDIAQQKKGQSQRTAARQDKDGAPFVMIAGVKYRPQPHYDDYFVTKIVRLGQPSAKKRRSP